MSTETSWYRIQDASRDPQALTDPANWISHTWKETRVGCAACNGTGSDWDDDGPLPCGTCEGRGDIDEPARRGVSVCRSLDALASYLDQSWGDVRDTVVIELTGDVSDEEDFDAKAGCMLVLPSRIVSVTPVAQVTELAEVLARDEAVR
jgi:hypothetical protein